MTDADGSTRLHAHPAGPAAGPAAAAPAGPTGREVQSTVTPVVRIASEWTLRLGVVGLGLYGLGRLLAEFSELLIPVLIAMLLAALLHPLVDALDLGGLPRPLAALVSLLLTLLVVVGLFVLVGEQVASGFEELRASAASGLQEVQDWLATGPLHISNARLEEYVTSTRDALSGGSSGVVSGAVGVASRATGLVEGLFIVLFSTFFFLSSGHRIWAWLLRMLPGPAQGPLDRAGRSGWVTLSHYVRATVIVAVVDGVGVGIGALVLGVPLALPLAVVVFFGAFVPVVGALITGILAILVALVAKGAVIALVMLGVVLAVNQLEAHVLQPFLLGRAVSVHPLAVILSLAAGAKVAGIVGALFAVPIAAVANTMITSLAGRSEDPGEAVARDDAPLATDAPAPTDTSRIPSP